ncbi:MAG: glycosyltransferase family 2 protein [Candidatus Bipolaricaulis sp.]|jgi:glycosyltransferase involved in cell wall biosynthesis
MKVSAIIPAFNEAERIAAVLAPLTSSPAVDEVIVVDDGSTDATSAEAERFGVRVVRLPENRGKAAAMAAGVEEARGDVLLFLDADLTGLTPSHIATMVDAYRAGDADVVIGVFCDGRLGTDLSQRIAGFLSGQRVMSRAHWERARGAVEDTEFGIETALTRLALKEGWRTKKVMLSGVSHIRKEEKRGFWLGFTDRMAMYWDVVRSFFRKL